VRPLLRKARLVDDEDRFREQAIQQRARQRRLQRRPRPRALIDELAQGLDIGAGEPVDQRTDRLPLAIEQQAAHVLAGVHLARGAPQQGRERGQKSP
jgi:hypothetical protein